MDQQALLTKIALLEFTNDQLVTELRELDTLLRAAGFEEGIRTLKGAVRECLQQPEEEEG